MGVSAIISAYVPIDIVQSAAAKGLKPKDLILRGWKCSQEHEDFKDRSDHQADIIKKLNGKILELQDEIDALKKEMEGNNEKGDQEVSAGDEGAPGNSL